MFDFLFRWRKASKCKKLIRRLQCRLKFLSIRRSSIVKQAREDTSELLNNGDHKAAFVRAEEILKDKSLLDAYDILDTYCEFIILHLPCISRHRKCPNNDIREAVSTLMFGASWFGDLPELQKIRKLFKARYGNKFAKAADGTDPGSHVNGLFREKLCVKSIPDNMKQGLIDELAKDLRRQLDTNESIIQNPQLNVEDASSHETKRIDCQGSAQQMISLESCGSNQIPPSPLGSKLEMEREEIQSSSFEDTNTAEKTVFFFNVLQKRSIHGSIAEASWLVLYPQQAHCKETTPVNDSCQDLDWFLCCCLEYPYCNCTTKGKEIAIYDQKLEGQETDHGDQILHSHFVLEESKRSKSYCKHVHPKLPDYDELVAKFVALKKEHRQRATVTS